MPPIRGALEAHDQSGQVRAPVMWGFVWGGIQAASTLAFWWLDAAIVLRSLVSSTLFVETPATGAQRQANGRSCRSASQS
jgi:hypothetical protein